MKLNFLVLHIRDHCTNTWSSVIPNNLVTHAWFQTLISPYFHMQSQFSVIYAKQCFISHSKLIFQDCWSSLSIITAMHSLHEHLLNYYVPGTVLDAGDSTECKKAEPNSLALNGQWREKEGNYHFHQLLYLNHCATCFTHMSLISKNDPKTQLRLSSTLKMRSFKVRLT